MITTSEQLAEYCATLADAETISFDTEFVAEHTYRSQLCLLQVEVAGQVTIIDTIAAGDMTPFWEAITEGDHETIVHAGREELVFCLAATGKVPVNLFDLQIAAGLSGLEYPAGYGSLANKLLNESPPKGETRTDWRRRPLSKRQLTYAGSDVLFLVPMRNELVSRLKRLDRMDWLATEMAAWVEQVKTSISRDRWQRVSGIAGLGPRNKAIVRELWLWRETEAERRDLPPRRVLRDDLIVEMAKRASADPKQISAVRGMDRGDLRKALPQLSEHVQRALDIPDDQLPRSRRRNAAPPQLNVLGQFLSAALGTMCRRAELAQSLVGNPTDVRELIAYRLGYARDDDPLPSLATGWRAGVVGTVIDDLLSGELSIRITNPTSDSPLSFEKNGN